MLPLSPDEAYYWVWSRALAAGYPDHPPMVALWIAAGTALFRDTALGVRLLAPLAAAVGSLLLADAAERLLPQPRRPNATLRPGIAAAAMLNATLLFGAGSVTMTPDTPLLLFWTATLWALARLLGGGDGRWFLAAGAAAGLALDSKYTAALLAPAILLWLLVVPGLRPWLRRWQPWAAAALAAFLFAPVVAWNGGHGWASFVRQGGRAGDWRPARAAQFLGELVAGQIGLATPLLALLFAVGTWAVLRRALRRDAAATLLALLVLLPAAVFFQHALGDRVQANWPSVCYPAAAIAAAGFSPGWRRWHAAAVGLGATVTVFAWLQGVAPLALPRRFDPTLIRLGGWPDLALKVRQAAGRDTAAFVAADNYGVASMLAWQSRGGPPVAGLDPRWALFALPPFTPTGPGLLVRSTRLQDSFAGAVRIGSVSRQRHSVIAEHYDLFRITPPLPAPASLLPRRR